MFSKNRDLLLEGDIAAKFLAAVLAQPNVKKLLSSDHFSVDGTLIEGLGLDEERQAQDGSGEPPAPPAQGGGRNAEANFHGQKRSNDTHASVTDPDARLYRKGKGRDEAVLHRAWANGEPLRPAGRRLPDAGGRACLRVRDLPRMSTPSAFHENGF